MNNISLETLKEWSKLGHRSSFSESLVLLAKERSDVVVVSPDLTTTARLINFEKEFPDRFFNVGIAEQNMIGFTAGLAREGLMPFAVSIAGFAPMRCAEQTRNMLGYMNLNARVVGIEAGCRFGPLGNTHFAMDDIGVMRGIPNFTIICPADAHEIYKTVFAVAEHKGPVHIRLTGSPGSPLIYPNDFDFKIGKAIEYRPGKDIAIIAIGSVLWEGIRAADILEKKGISVRVIDMHTVKPIDVKMLDSVFLENKLIVTVEEHSIIGGLGSAVAEYKAGFENAPRQIRCGLGDSFKKIGNYEFQMKENGLVAEDIAETVVNSFELSKV
jgi:transketolase